MVEGFQILSFEVTWMQFTDLGFLFLFLPLLVASCYWAAEKWRNTVILLGGVLFYGLATNGDLLSGGIILLFASVVYVSGRILENGHGKWLLWVIAAAMAGSLLFLKCFGTYLPLGFSFFVLQAYAYLRQIQEGNMAAEKNLIHFGVLFLFFPKVAAGPLVDPVDFSNQIRHRSLSPSGIRQGLQRFLAGLVLKVLLANRIRGLWVQTAILGYENVTFVLAWLALIAFALQLYFDFWGYSLMARGIGGMLGFSLPENFDSPYASASVREFYRRWHKTLGFWFRDYVYIPLGGSKAGKGLMIRNILLVWLLTGLWHGISWNYLIWSGTLAAAILLEHLRPAKILSGIGTRSVTLLLILFSWIPFATESLPQALCWFGKLFGIGASAADAFDFVPVLQGYGWLLATGVLLLFPHVKEIWEKYRSTRFAEGCLLVLFWICVYRIVTQGQDPFAYFQF